MDIAVPIDKRTRLRLTGERLREDVEEDSKETRLHPKLED